MKHLTTSHDIKQFVRPVSKHIDDQQIDIYITEAEQINIKPHIGDALYIDLVEYENHDNKQTFPTQYETLLSGGQYTTTLAGKQTQKTFVGLRTALNYYVYSKLIKNNDQTLTRFGYVIKTDEHSTKPDFKTKLAAEKDAQTIADHYLAQCIQYLNTHKHQFPQYTHPYQPKNKLRIKTIGD